MTDEQLNRANRDDLLQIIRALLPELASLKAEVASFQGGGCVSREKVTQSHRQASPFSKGKPKADPKKLGRRAGKRPFTRRSEPEVGSGDRVEDLAARKVPLESPTGSFAGKSARPRWSTPPTPAGAPGASRAI